MQPNGQSNITSGIRWPPTLAAPRPAVLPGTSAVYGADPNRDLNDPRQPPLGVSIAFLVGRLLERPGSKKENFLNRQDVFGDNPAVNGKII